MLITALTIASGTLAVAGAVPYISQILRDPRKADAQLSSWVIWAAAFGVGAVAAFCAHPRQPASGVFTGLSAAACAATAVLAWRNGTRAFSRLDAVCAALATAGIILLVLAIATPARVPIIVPILAGSLTGLVAYVPTYRHGWRRPREEVCASYVLYAASAAAAVTATLLAPWHGLAGLLYPGYLLCSDTAMIVVVLTRRGPGRHRIHGRVRHRGGVRYRHGAIILAATAAVTLAAAIPAGIALPHLLRHPPPAAAARPRASAPANAAILTFGDRTGPGCPPTATSRTLPYQATNGDGWHPSAGAGPCGGMYTWTYLAMIPGYPAAWHDSYTWLFSTQLPNPTCTVAIYIPPIPQASAPAWYWTGAGNPPAHLLAAWTISQPAHRGQWVTEGPWRYPGGIIAVELTDRGATGQLAASAAAGPVQIHC